MKISSAGSSTDVYRFVAADVGSVITIQEKRKRR
jgi:hypothetical protein